MVFLVHRIDEKTGQIDLIWVLSGMPLGVNWMYSLERVVSQFEKWLAKLPNAGARGFNESELKKVYGKQYQKAMSDWIARGWIEQRDSHKLDLWWISRRGSRALESVTVVQRGLQEGIEGSDD